MRLPNQFRPVHRASIATPLRSGVMMAQTNFCGCGCDFCLSLPFPFREGCIAISDAVGCPPCPPQAGY